MTVLFTDSGTGADANPIGGSYVTMTGWAGLKRLSNTIANAAGSDGDCGARINVTTDNDHYCKIRPSTVSNRDFGCMVRCQSGSAGGVTMTDYNAADVECYVFVAGSFGSFVDRDTGTYQTTSDVYMEVQGTSYVTKIGASTINSFTDATFSSGQAGIFMYDSGARVINVEVGNFSSGTAYTLAMGQGSYALTGQATALKADRRMSVGQGAYALSGQSVGLAYGHKISMAQGSYTLSGQAVNLIGPAVGYSLAMGQGSYSLIGSDAAADYVIAMGAGSYTLTGNPVGLAYGHKIACAQGAYAYSGSAAALRATRIMVASQGSYALSGQAVGLTPTANKLMTAEPGLYTLTGNSVSLVPPLGGAYPIDRPFDPFNWWRDSFCY